MLKSKDRHTEWPSDVFYDNKDVVSLMKSDVRSAKGQHIDVSYHYVHDMIERQEIKVDYIPSEKMTANPMKKKVVIRNFYESNRKRGINVYQLT